MKSNKSLKKYKSLRKKIRRNIKKKKVKKYIIKMVDL